MFGMQTVKICLFFISDLLSGLQCEVYSSRGVECLSQNFLFIILTAQLRSSGIDMWRIKAGFMYRFSS